MFVIRQSFAVAFLKKKYVNDNGKASRTILSVCLFIYFLSLSYKQCSSSRLCCITSVPQLLCLYES